MKPHRLWIMFVLLALIVTACGSPSPTPTVPVDDSWESVKSAGTLRVGTSADYPPFEYINDQYQIDGFDIALINEVAKQLGVSAQINNYAFDGLLATVQLGQEDAAIGAISITPERQEVVDFSNVYLATSDAVLVKADSTLSPQTPDLLATVRLGVQQGSVYQGYAQTRLVDTGEMPPENLLVYQDITQAVNDVKTGLIEAVWLGLIPAQEFAKDGSVKIAAENVNQQLYGIAVQKGATALQGKINEALLTLQNNGTIATLQQQYLQISPAEVVTPPVQPTPVPAQPTATPAPAQATATPVPCINGASWVSDLSFDDNNMTNPPVMQPGQPFTKGWRLKNSGTCPWTTSYKLAYSSGNVPAAQMGGQPIAVTRTVNPGETFDFQVNLIAPMTPGTYQGLWNMQNGNGTKFGQTVWVGITVSAGPTQTPSPSITFKASSTEINAGDVVIFSWSTSNVKAVYFYHDGQNWQDNPVGFSGEDDEHPPSTMTYYLRVVNLNDSVTEKAILITVNQPVAAPVIDQFDVTPATILVGECASLLWSVSGDVTSVELAVNSVVVWPNAPIYGSYQDCPTVPGQQMYQLTATGPGGSIPAYGTITVNNP